MSQKEVVSPTDHISLLPPILEMLLRQAIVADAQTEAKVREAITLYNAQRASQEEYLDITLARA